MKNYILLALSALVLNQFAFGQIKKTFRDDFNNNNNNWPQRSWTKETGKIADGKFYLGITDKKTYNFCETNLWINPKYDFSIETKATQTSGTHDNGYGFVWGYYRKEDYNMFQISSDGYFNISKTVNGKTETIVKWKKLKDTTLINPQNGWNVLKMSQKGNKNLFYVNNTLVYESKSLPVSGVQFGPYCRNIMDVQFDYIEVNYADSKINEINSSSNYQLENLGPNINSKSEEKSVKVSADGKTIFFSKTGEENLFNAKTSEIYRSDLQEDGTWGKAQNLNTPINNKGHNFPVNISPDKNELYVGNVFSSTGEFVSTGISKSEYANGKWSHPKKVVIKDLVNDKNQTSYTVTPDGKHILLGIANTESYGGHDLFVSFLEDDGTWSKPKNMGDVLNTTFGEFTPFVAGDNKTLFFSSYGHKGYGSADIFMSKRLDDTWTKWSEPVNVGKNVNSSKWDAFYCISAKGDYAYLTAYNKKDGYGSGDVYRIKLPKELKPDPVTIVSGKVIDAETKKAIDATIIYEDLKTGEELGIALSSKENGFQISLPSGKNYGFLAKSKNYISVSENIDLTNLNEYASKEVNLEVAPIKKGQVVRINNLFFDLGKYSLRNESKNELNRLVKLLKSNANINIEVIGHTDSQGNKESNQKLSQNRAKSVLNYLVNNGVSGSRISSKGEGSSSPVESNDTETGRQRNRRVEFKIK